MLHQNMLDLDQGRVIYTGFGIPMQRWLQITNELLDAWRNVLLLKRAGMPLGKKVCLQHI